MSRTQHGLKRIGCALGIGIFIYVCVACVFADETAKSEASAASNVSFAREVAPILVKRCIACHGPKKPEGEFQLHTFARLMKGGASGEPPLVPGKPDESYLVELITSGDADVRMPKEQTPLGAAEIDLLRRWIAGGATFDGPDAAAPLESIIPRGQYPRPPDVYPRPVPITALAFSPDGTTLATSGYHEILIWSVLPSGTPGIREGEPPGEPLALHGSAGASPSHTSSPALVKRIRNIPQRTHAIAFNGDGTLMAVAAGTPGRMGEVKLFDARTGENIADLVTTADEMFDVEFSRDGSKLAACGADRYIRIFDVAERKELRRIEAHADWVMAVAWSHDGTRLASAGRDKAAKVIDPATGAVIVTYPGHEEQVYDVVFSASGEHVFSAGRGRELHRWLAAGDDSTKKDIRTKVTGAIVGRTRGEIYKLALAEKHILAMSSDGKLIAYDVELKDKREPVMTYEGAPRQAFALALHEPSGRIAVGGFDGRVMMYQSGDSAPWSVLIAAPFTAGPGATAGPTDSR